MEQKVNLRELPKKMMIWRLEVKEVDPSLVHKTHWLLKTTQQKNWKFWIERFWRINLGQSQTLYWSMILISFSIKKKLINSLKLLNARLKTMNSAIISKTPSLTMESKRQSKPIQPHWRWRNHWRRHQSKVEPWQRQGLTSTINCLFLYCMLRASDLLVPILREGLCKTRGDLSIRIGSRSKLLVSLTSQASLCKTKNGWTNQNQTSPIRSKRLSSRQSVISYLSSLK